MTILLAIAVGLAIGLLLGAVGGGGSILAVPALVYLLGQPPHEAATGALVVVGLSAVAAVVAHSRADHVRFAQGLLFGLLGVGGSYAGARASANVDPDLLMTGFAALMLVAAAGMLRGRAARPSRRARVWATTGPTMSTSEEATAAGEDAASAAHGQTATAAAVTTVPEVGRARVDATVVRQRLTVGRVITIVVTATAVGFLTGFFGVGGGFLVVPALVLALGFEMPAAVGTSLLVIAMNAATALAVRLGSPAPDWPLLATFAAAAISGSLAGQTVGARLRPRRLSMAFLVICVVLAAVIAAVSVRRLLAT